MTAIVENVPLHFIVWKCTFLIDNKPFNILKKTKKVEKQKNQKQRISAHGKSWDHVILCTELIYVLSAERQATHGARETSIKPRTCAVCGFTWSS